MSVNTSYNNYKAVYDYSSQTKKDMAFAKANGLDYDLAMKGQSIEAMRNRSDGRLSGAYDYENKTTIGIPDKDNPFKTNFVSVDSEEGKAQIAKLIEERDKALAEYAKYKELKGASNDAKTDSPVKKGKYPVNGGKKNYDSVHFDMDKLSEVKAGMKGNIGAYQKMVASQIKTQAGHADTTLQSMLRKVSKMSQSDAAKAISGDGEWGVEATANRILNFAKALAGDDPSKIETLKEAVKKGFAAAEKVWGGQLPSISYQTLQKVMDGFDEWEKSYNSTEAGIV